MKAAVITSFSMPPRYTEFAEPVAASPAEMVVDVLAAGLHHVTRGKASGAHYSSPGALPMIPGVDGVGRGSDGKLRYFGQAPDQLGTMAQRTVIRLDQSFVLPDGSDPVAVAAAMNPGMSAWLALRCRAPFQPGQKLLIVGATGSSGSMAVQIARHLGAGQIIAVGRDTRKLATLSALGATHAVTMDDPALGGLANEVDVVLDYVWGESSVRLMERLLKQRADRGQKLSWVQIGSTGGDVAGIPGAFLRSANLQLLGSGIGSLSMRQIVAELPALIQEVALGTFRIDARAVPLSQVEQVWTEPVQSSARIVFTP